MLVAICTLTAYAHLTDMCLLCQSLSCECCGSTVTHFALKCYYCGSTSVVGIAVRESTHTTRTAEIVSGNGDVEMVESIESFTPTTASNALASISLPEEAEQQSIRLAKVESDAPLIAEALTGTIDASRILGLVGEAIRMMISNRPKRNYLTLSRSQKHYRNRLSMVCLNALGVPPSSLSDQRIAPHQIAHVGTSFRKKVRKLALVKLPCEQRVITAKLALADHYATATSVWLEGSYVLDPVRYVAILRSNSQSICVGGDSGGGTLKIGITYTSMNNCRYFAPLLVQFGGDKRSELERLNEPGLTPFTGMSAGFDSIWSVLQKLIDDDRTVLLNGDWKFISAVIGHQGASANYPCPICRVEKGNLLAKYLTRSKRYNPSVDKPPLLRISPLNIVTLPLHTCIGLQSRIVLKVLPKLYGEDAVREQVSTIRTVHTAFGGGLADVFSLNGAELDKWVKKGCMDKLKAAADAVPIVDPESVARTLLRSTAEPVLRRWMSELPILLLSHTPFDGPRISQLEYLAKEMAECWTAATGIPAFPKLHMLQHAPEFARRFGFLGFAAESPIESFHASFNALFDRIHLNSASRPAIRLQRSLSDATLAAIAPFVQA